jgi:hypothetical protein
VQVVAECHGRSCCWVVLISQKLTSPEKGTAAPPVECHPPWHRDAAPAPSSSAALEPLAAPPQPCPTCRNLSRSASRVMCRHLQRQSRLATAHAVSNHYCAGMSHQRHDTLSTSQNCGCRTSDINIFCTRVCGGVDAYELGRSHAPPGMTGCVALDLACAPAGH